MTATTTAIEPSKIAGKIVATNGASLTDALRALTAAEKNQTLVPVGPSAPKKAALPEACITALSEVAAMVAATTVPNTVRKLQPGEVANFVALKQSVDSIQNALKGVMEDTVREAIFNHFDKVAEESGLVDETTPRDTKGHYILEDKQSAAVPGMEKKFTREVRSGSVSMGSSVFEADRLLALEAQGVITHEEYLTMTRQTRVVDEIAILNLMKKDPELLTRVRQAAQVGADTVSLYLRKNG